MSKIGFIGTGHIAAPMVRRMVRLGHEVTVTERSTEVSSALSVSHGVGVGSAQDVLNASDIVFLCLRPSVAPTVLEPLNFRPDQQIISVMAEHAETTLAKFCSPATSITRTIPFGFVETGGCPLPVWGDVDLIRSLFGPDNTILTMPTEDGLNAILSASAVMAAQLDLLNTVKDWTEDKIGDALVAETYVKALVQGVLTNLPNEAGKMAQERDDLTLPGSLNRFVMEEMQNATVHEPLTNALDTVYQRLTQS